MTRNRPSYLDRISQDPAIMVGKPVVKGTRVPVAPVIAHLAENPDLDDHFAAYPHLTLEDVKACLAYAHARLERDRRASRQKSMPRTSPATVRVCWGTSYGSSLTRAPTHA